ncbi:MAG: hypothetical protein VX951_02030 [Planctomycetota bacterium]|nr:hypothetical protein [Planctomycetota bacterium]
MIWTTVIAITLAGLLGVLLAPALATRRALTDLCTAFAAGVLLTIILVHVLPESVEKDQQAGGALILVGFVAMMLLQQKVLKADPCCGHEHHKHAGLPSYLALVACSINDGILLHHEIAAHIESVWTSALFWAMCGHKLTASFALVMLLKETSGGLKSGMRMVYMLVFVAITPAVILLAENLRFLNESMHYVVAVGAGALLYVIFGGMVPRVEHLAHEGKSNKVFITFLIGVGITVALELSSSHSH